jgi:hypothetical protein
LKVRILLNIEIYLYQLIKLFVVIHEMHQGTKEVGMRFPKNLERNMRGAEREREKEREAWKSFSGNGKILVAENSCNISSNNFSRKCYHLSLGMSVISHD